MTRQNHQNDLFISLQGDCDTRIQGRSQPHSPGWARVQLFSFFPQISINFSYFSSNFSHFLPHFGPPGGQSPTREGPGYATARIDNPTCSV